MSIDIFGRISNRNDIQYNKGIPGAPGIGFKLTSDNQFDLDGKRLCNVAEPIAENDSATLSSMRSTIKHETERILKLIINLESTIQQCATEVKTLKDTINKLTKLEKRVNEQAGYINTLQMFFDEQLIVNDKVQKQQQILTEKVMSDWRRLVDIDSRLTKLENKK